MSLADDVPVALTKKSLERWRAEASAGIEPNEGWASVIVTLIDYLRCEAERHDLQMRSMENDYLHDECRH